MNNNVDIKPFVRYSKTIHGLWQGTVKFADGYNFSYSSDEAMQKAKPTIARRLQWYVYEDESRDLIALHGNLVPWPKKTRKPQ